MKILALELSSGQGSIAFADGEREPRLATFANDRKHSGAFFQALREMLDGCGSPDRIAVGIGPGSYAGTRIAISAAIGLQAATGAELLGLPSLCAMEISDAEYCVIGDARRQTYFLGHVIDRVCDSGPTLCTADELRAALTTIRVPILATEPLLAFPGAIVQHPSAAILARLAARPHANVTREPLQPLYLREAHITQPKGPR